MAPVHKKKIPPIMIPNKTLICSSFIRRRFPYNIRRRVSEIGSSLLTKARLKTKALTREAIPSTPIINRVGSWPNHDKTILQTKTDKNPSSVVYTRLKKSINTLMNRLDANHIVALKLIPNANSLAKELDIETERISSPASTWESMITIRQAFMLFTTFLLSPIVVFGFGLADVTIAS